MMPKNSEILSREGKALVEIGAMDMASNVLMESLNLDSKNMEGKIYLGQVYFLKGKTKEAIRLLNEAHADDPQNFHVNYYLGLYYLQRKGDESQKKALGFLENLSGLGNKFVLAMKFHE